MENHQSRWYFCDDSGTFKLDNPHLSSYLYFPLVNEAGMMSVITPSLHGDAKTGQNTFLLPPVSVEDLHNSRSARNFWVHMPGVGAWSATGNSATQIAGAFANDETVQLEAGFLWHKLTRKNLSTGLQAEIINFVPPSQDKVELMQVRLTNTGPAPLRLSPTAAIPLYGRSADNLRDHRHVTSLLHRISTQSYGVVVRPSLSFDERGHQPNNVSYLVLGAEPDGSPPAGFFPLIQDFIGEGGCLEWPESIVHNQQNFVPAGQVFEGYEALGGIRFKSITLQPGETAGYILVLAIIEDNTTPEALLSRYNSPVLFDEWLKRNQEYWETKLSSLSFSTGKSGFDRWIKWVAVQPVLRRLFGNSFLPYHDYGRGGRGWRDLWQDCLALLMMEPEAVPDLLYSSFAGVRMDGSNATIIGSKPGEFKADRNNIPRVWMDHGAWPFLTTHLYIHQTGDLDFLLRGQTYFKDGLAFRTRQRDTAWQAEQGTLQYTQSGQVYQGSILEHILIQHLTAFFNVGEHNNLKLEDADWNDGIDMAAEKGESVAFSALYTGNLEQLSLLAQELDRHGIHEIELAAELLPLLDTLSDPVDYESVPAKQAILNAYFASCRHMISGEKIKVSTHDLGRDLSAKAGWLCLHIRTQEWIQAEPGLGWFNGYYDNLGRRVEGESLQGVRMTLTGQVFTLMCAIATGEQASQVIRAADRYLLDESIGGYRLNTDFHEVRLDLGRCFGFAFGHKENGAMFSHMDVMFANALYQRGFVAEGCWTLERIFAHCQDFKKSRMYPGIPEYFDPRGRGLYTYLTGSASWYLLTLLTEAFGVKGKLGDLVLEPKLVSAQFNRLGEASVSTLFAGRRLQITYHNPSGLDYGAYHIRSILIDGQATDFENSGKSALLSKGLLEALSQNSSHSIVVELE